MYMYSIYKYIDMYVYYVLCICLYALHMYIIDNYMTYHTYTYDLCILYLCILPAQISGAQAVLGPRQGDGMQALLLRSGISHSAFWPWQVFYVKDPSFASAFGVVWATKC